MIAFLRRNRQPFIISIVIIFFIGIFVGLGGYFFTGIDTTESVAIVEGTKIPYGRFRARVDQSLYVADRVFHGSVGVIGVV